MAEDAPRDNVDRHAHHELVGVITNQEIDHQMLLVWLGTNEAG